MQMLPRIKRLPFYDDAFDNIVLTEKELHARCFITHTHADSEQRRKPRAHVGADVSHMHLSYLCSFRRFASLSICDLSNNFVSDIQPLSYCMSLVWLDIHSNHIEELPGEYFWSGLVSLRILNAHDNPIATLFNIKYLSACRNLELLTLYDTPVAVHPFYRHCCVNKISTLKALDNYVIADDEVIEGFICPPKFTKFADGLRVKTIPYIKEGIAGVLDILRRVNTIHAKLSPCLFIQRVYRAYCCRKQLKIALKSAKRRTKDGVEPVADGIFNLTAVLNISDLNFLSKLDISDTALSIQDRLPPIIPPTTPTQTSHGERQHIATTVPTASTLRMIFHKLVHSNLLNEFEDVMDSIRARRMDGKTDEYVREVAETVFEEIAEEEEGFPQKAPPHLKDKNLINGAFFVTTKSYESADGSSFEIPEYRVSTSSDLMMVPEGETIILSNMELKQLEAQLIKQADFDYHAKHHLETLQELAVKQEAIGMTPVNVNAVRDRVAAEEHLTQQLACLAAVEKAYHERTVRENKFEKATTILASREATTQGIRKSSSLVHSAHMFLGNDIRTQKHLTHLLLSKLREKDEMDKRANHQKRVAEKLARRGKMKMYQAASDLRQRFCAISASINKYDWTNRQQGVVERSKAVVEQVQHGKQAASALTAEQNRKRINDTVAVNQLEIRRGHEAIISANELDIAKARRRVSRVKHDRPDRYPPQLPGPGSLVVDGICHAAYNPVIGASQFEERSQSGYSSVLENRLPRQEIVDIHERWKVLAGVPDGRIGLHPIEAELL